MLDAFEQPPVWPPNGEDGFDAVFVTASGERAVLKIAWPDDEGQHEILGLQTWHGRGAVRLLLADPRRTELARHAWQYLGFTPGTDVALLNGMLHVVISEGLTDEVFVRARLQCGDGRGDALAAEEAQVLGA